MTKFMKKEVLNAMNKVKQNIKQGWEKNVIKRKKPT